MILIAAPSLLTQAENAFITSHDVTIVPFGDGRRGRPVRSRDQHNHSHIRNVGLTVSYTNYDGRL